MAGAENNKKEQRRRKRSVLRQEERVGLRQTCPNIRPIALGTLRRRPNHFCRRQIRTNSRIAETRLY